MMRRNRLLAVILAGVLLVSVAPVATAHEWQTTASDGPMELGVSTSPETPVAGMETGFAARVKDADPAGDANRTSWGGVTNQTVEIHIRGPGGYHDHVAAEIPADEAHFHWSYMFPLNGTFEIEVHLETEGQEFQLGFERDVMLLPTDAQGETLAEMAQEIDDLSQKVDRLEHQLSEHGGGSPTGETASVPGFTAAIVAMAVVGAAAYTLGKRKG